MKYPSPDLYHLVQRLSASERRYLKVRAFREEGQTVRLLDRLLAMREYDERRLKKDFPNLAVQKRYLYRWILRGLQQYADKEIEQAIRADLDHAWILFRKGLPKQANKLLERVAEKSKEIRVVSPLVKCPRTSKTTSRQNG